jgi:hypothetical protein
MQWTTKKPTNREPTKSDYYWYKPTERIQWKYPWAAFFIWGGVVSVFKGWVAIPGHKTNYKVEDLEGEWAGPIEPPQERQ